MTNNFFLKIVKFLLCLVPLTVVIVYQGSIFPFIVGKYVFLRTTVELALAFFVWAWVFGEFQFRDFKQHLKQPLVIAVSAFVFIFLLAGFLGYNPPVSFWSNYERGEGEFQMLHFFVFFILLTFLFKDKESWRRIFIVSLGAAVFMVAYGVAATFHIGNFIGGSLCERFSGSLGNPAYTGTYLIFSLFYAAYLFTEDKQRLKKWWWVILLIAFSAFLVFTQTRGAFLGLGSGIIAGLLYALFHVSTRWMRLIIAGLIFVLVAAGALGIIYRRSINLAPFCESGNKILDVTFSAETFQTRLLLWKQSIQAFGERPILGWGPENFSAAFEKYYDTRHAAWFDRAHNIFFDYLIFAGALGLLSFIGIFIAFYRKFFRWTRINTDEKPLEADRRGNKQQSLTINHWSLVQKSLIFGLPIAYLVQGIVLFDVLPIYINLFLFLAFANWRLSYEIRNSYETTKR